MSRGDEIDQLVSSVRNFVAHKDAHRPPVQASGDKLLLTPDNRLSDEQVKAIDAEWAAELHALETAGLVAPGKALELSESELEEAVSKLPDDWEATSVSCEAESPDKDGAGSDSVEQTAADKPQLEIDTAELEAMISAKISDMIDQDALRAMVVKTVHEELGGDLGERITRNVRKLVRREINRVITSRDLSGD